MTTTTTIVVGINGSAAAGAALKLGHRLAAALPGSVIAIDAATAVAGNHSGLDADRYRRGVFHGLRESLPPDALENTTVRVVPGDADHVLLEQARELGAAYLLIGSEPSEGRTSLGIGSLAHRLAHGLGCPLLVVPAPASDDVHPVGNDVVVGIDGSDASRVALELSTGLARAFGGSVYAVYAIDGIYDTFTTHDYFGEEEHDARVEAASEPLVRYVARTGGRPEQVLAEVAAQHGAAMVVVAARERHSLGGTLLGRIPDRLLHRPPCPVMVLPRRFVEAAAHRPALRHS